MPDVPEGAQLSDDGKWWWDGTQWQPVDGAAPADASGGDRAAARVARGLPASLTDVTDEQRRGYMGQPTIEVEEMSLGEVEVLAMRDDGGSGEAYA